MENKKLPGRPRLYLEPLIAASVTLTESQRDALRQIDINNGGKGNVSSGIRIVLELYQGIQDAFEDAVEDTLKDTVEDAGDDLPTPNG